MDPWRHNLAWLGAHDPALRRRLTANGAARLVEREGTLLWNAGLTPVSVDLPESLASAVLPAAPGPWVLLGAGGGEVVKAALDRGDHLVVWDRDPSFLLPLLRRVDLTAALEAGRVRLAVGADWAEHLALPRVLHPVLGAGYRAEAAWPARFPARRALLVDGGLFVDDVADALQQAGIAVFRWDVAHVSADELQATASRLAPERVLAINHTHGLPEACAALQLPLSIWEIDPATDRVTPGGPGARVFTWRASAVKGWRSLGYDAEHLPLAANPDRRTPGPPDPGLAAPIAYVGSSMVGRARELLAEWLDTFERVYGPGSREGGRQIAEGVLAAQREAGRAWVVPGVLSHIAPGLDLAFAAAGSPHRADAALAEAAAAEDRQRVLGGIADLGLHVWGDPGWKALETRGARYRGWAGHHHELTRIYRSARVQIDVNRLYQRDIVPMRIFDALACGAFVLAEHSEELERCFEVGREVVAWTTPKELRQLTAFYLAHPREAAEVAARGRARVLHDHTVAARVARLLAA